MNSSKQSQIDFSGPSSWLLYVFKIVYNSNTLTWDLIK